MNVKAAAIAGLDSKIFDILQHFRAGQIFVPGRCAGGGDVNDSHIVAPDQNVETPGDGQCEVIKGAGNRSGLGITCAQTRRARFRVQDAAG